jgi:hypothetical protein
MTSFTFALFCPYIVILYYSNEMAKKEHNKHNTCHWSPFTVSLSISLHPEHQNITAMKSWVLILEMAWTDAKF